MSFREKKEKRLDDQVRVRFYSFTHAPFIVGILSFLPVLLLPSVSVRHRPPVVQTETDYVEIYGPAERKHIRKRERCLR
jgi:hypothetical protein